MGLIRWLSRFLLQNSSSPKGSKPPGKAPTRPHVSLASLTAPPGILLSIPLFVGDYPQLHSVCSDHDSEKVYSVDLYTLTCSCGDFTERRAHLPARSPGRICKHIRNVLFRSGAYRELEGELFRAILNEAHPKSHYVAAQLPSGSQVGLGFSPGDVWVDVYARQAKRGEKAGRCTGDYTLFGFNLAGSEWSYGDGPLGAREIREYIRQQIRPRVGVPR